MEINKQITLAEIVKDNFHTADVFESYGLDFAAKETEQQKKSAMKRTWIQIN